MTSRLTDRHIQAHHQFGYAIFEALTTRTMIRPLYWRAIGLACWAVAALALPLPASAINWPDVQLTLFTNGLSRPVHVANAGDGSGRIFVCEQDGRIKIVNDGNVTTFLDIDARVRSVGDGGGGEQGLMSVAFQPDYETSGYFYVFYTELATSDLNISRFKVSSTNANVADANSEDILLSIPHPGSESHNAGQLAFSPADGHLYISTGDGGGNGDPGENAQDLSTMLGKILRIDVTSVTNGYLVPPSNPFVGETGLDEIWAYGLRNPFRFSFDPANGDLYIGDVGQFLHEEIDYQPASNPGGENYGWDCYEGSNTFELTDCGAATNYVFPAFEYSSAGGSGNCTVIGGHVSRATPWSFMYGKYFYADYCAGRIWALVDTGSGWTNRLLLDVSHRIASFGEDEAGNLYATDQNNGRVYRLDEIFADSDNDQMYDAWEVFYGLNTNDAADATTDLDGDRSSNRDEFKAGTVPTNAASVLQVGGIDLRSDTDAVLTWSSEPDATYFLQRAADLASPFTTIASNLPATPPMNVYTDSPTGGTNGFYRAGVE